MIIPLVLLLAQLIKISIVDSKIQKIRNKDLVVFYGLALFYHYAGGEYLLTSGIRSIVAIIILSLFYKGWKKGIGSGDIKLLAIAYVLLGEWKICMVCVISIVFLIIYLIIRFPQKQWRGLYIPLAPFISGSIFIMMLL